MIQVTRWVLFIDGIAAALSHVLYFFFFFFFFFVTYCEVLGKGFYEVMFKYYTNNDNEIIVYE